MSSFSSLTQAFKRFRRGVPLDPARDWIIMITFAVIVLIGTIVWDAWAFDTVARGGVIGTQATSSPVMFNRSAFDSIQAVFASRAAEEAKYVTGTYRMTDPSQ